jgi:Protein of unknown function (DUF3278).
MRPGKPGWTSINIAANNSFIFFYALAALSLVAIIVPIKWPNTSALLLIGTILLGVIVLGMSGYIAYAGGKIRHKEFRTEPPPKKPASSPG